MLKHALIACFVVASGNAGMAQVSFVPTTPPPALAQPDTNIVCGTRILRADPKLDAKIAKPVPRGMFSLKVLEPPVCRNTFPTSTVDLKRRLPQFLGPKR